MSQCIPTTHNKKGKNRKSFILVMELEALVIVYACVCVCVYKSNEIKDIDLFN
jgi:hypothetical protein